MADPKYENLPGIAYDQPDIYETADIPDQETSDYYEEEIENESIERLHISTKNSYNRFKGKYLTGNVDFSDVCNKKNRSGYDARSADWELVAEGEKETPIQRCRRLQCEMNELIEEVSAVQSGNNISQEEKNSYEAISLVLNSAKKILNNLRLEQVLGKESFGVISDQELNNLMTNVEQFKKSEPSIQLLKENSLAENTRIAELEHTLHKLETAIGAQPENINRLAGYFGTYSLLEAVQQLSTKVALIQNNQLDLIEARLNNVTTKIDAITGKTEESNEYSARDQKTMELYEIARRTEPIAKILPEMLSRMQSLEKLHNYAANFSKLITELETTQTSISIGLANNKGLLQSIQEAFALNLENINTEVTKLNERINLIVKNSN